MKKPAAGGRSGKAPPSEEDSQPVQLQLFVTAHTYPERLLMRHIYDGSYAVQIWYGKEKYPEAMRVTAEEGPSKPPATGPPEPVSRRSGSDG